MSDPKNRIRRILNVIPYIRKNQGIELDELVRYCGATNAREVLGDLDRILLCGVPPYLPDDYIGVYVEGGRVEIRFADHFRRPVRFTPSEALALLVAIEALPEGGSEEHIEAKRSLASKIRGILSGAIGSGVPGGRSVEGRIETRAGTGPSRGFLAARRHYREVLAVLRPAVDERREVEIEYYSASKDETRARVVRPLGFVDRAGDLYLAAHCRMAGKQRSFRVDRIRSARALEQRFEPPARFDIDRYAKKRMNFQKDHRFTARVRVHDERVVRWLKDARPGDVQIDRASGAAVVTVRAYEMPWLLNEVLSYGPSLEVLGPPEVREALAEHTRAMALRAREAPEAAALP